MREVDDYILKRFIELGAKSNKEAGVIRYSTANRNKVTLYIDHLLMAFLESRTVDELNVNTFLAFCSQQMTPDRCAKVFNETLEQSSKAEWYYIRFSRITASRCSRCNTADGALVASVM